MKKKKAETKNDPPPIDDAAPSRVTVETVVTDGQTGLARLAKLTRLILHVSVPK